MPLYYPMGFDSGYLLLVVVSLVLGFATQHYIDSTYKRWSRVPVPDGRTGAFIARSMLEADGVGGFVGPAHEAVVGGVGAEGGSGRGYCE